MRSGGVVVTPSCLRCDVPLPPRPAGMRGRHPKYCSAKCKDRQAHAGRRMGVPVTQCTHCGRENPPPVRGAARRFCSAACRHRANAAAERYGLVCEFCQAPFMASRAGRRFCSLSCVTSHKNAAKYADHEYVPTGKGHRGRAHRYGLVYEPVDRDLVFERDEWLCGLCTAPVDRLLEWPHPLSASLDHVMPMSRGGDHIYANVQCAHLRCNLTKGASVYAWTAPEACG